LDKILTINYIMS